jgi:hypothetical protein
VRAELSRSPALDQPGGRWGVRVLDPVGRTRTSARGLAAECWSEAFRLVTSSAISLAHSGVIYSFSAGITATIESAVTGRSVWAK